MVVSETKLHCYDSNSISSNSSSSESGDSGRFHARCHGNIYFLKYKKVLKQSVLGFHELMV